MVAADSRVAPIGASSILSARAGLPLAEPCEVTFDMVVIGGIVVLFSLVLKPFTPPAVRRVIAAWSMTRGSDTADMRVIDGLPHPACLAASTARWQWAVAAVVREAVCVGILLAAAPAQPNNIALCWRASSVARTESDLAWEPLVNLLARGLPTLDLTTGHSAAAPAARCRSVAAAAAGLGVPLLPCS